VPTTASRPLIRLARINCVARCVREANQRETLSGYQQWTVPSERHGSPDGSGRAHVTPAEAGVQYKPEAALPGLFDLWIPAFAGMTCGHQQQ